MLSRCSKGSLRLIRSLSAMGESSDQVTNSVSLMVKSTEFRILLTDTLAEVGKPPITSLELDEGSLSVELPADEPEDPWASLPMWLRSMAEALGGDDIAVGLAILGSGVGSLLLLFVGSLIFFYRRWSKSRAKKKRIARALKRHGKNAKVVLSSKDGI